MCVSEGFDLWSTILNFFPPTPALPLFISRLPLLPLLLRDSYGILPGLATSASPFWPAESAEDCVLLRRQAGGNLVLSTRPFPAG